MSGRPEELRLGADDVRRIAELARLRLTDDEAARFAAQFEGILAHFAALAEADAPGAAPPGHPLAIADVLRDDAPRPGLARDDALAAAPDAADGAFRVPRVAPGRGP